jgi:hypothetical protein
MAELFEGNAYFPTLVLGVIVAERFFRAIRRPQPRREIWIGLEAQRRRSAQHRLEAVDQLRDLVGHRLGSL